MAFFPLTRLVNPSDAITCPIADITTSASTVNSLPATGTGRALPEASFSPLSILMQVTVRDVLFLFIPTGAQRNCRVIPSSCVSATSVSWAGMSFIVRL